MSDDNTTPEGFKMTELGLLPEEWEVVRLGEVAKTYSGGTPAREKSEYWGGEIPWLKSGELNDRWVFSSEEYITEEGFNNSSTKFIEDNTLLMAMYGATAGKVGLAKSRFVINQAICAITPNDSFYSTFYFYYLMMIRDKILLERFGGAQPNLNQQIIKNLFIPFLPFPEQKKIAAVLSAVQEAKEKTEAVIQAARELKRSLMKHLFTYGPVSLEDAEHVPLKETEIGLMPEDWEVVRLGNVSSELRIRNKDLILGKNNVLTVSNIDGFYSSNRILGKDFCKYKIVSYQQFAYNPMRLNIGSIALRDIKQPGLVSPDYIVFECDKNKINPEYFNQFRLTKYWKSQISKSGQGSVRIRYYYRHIAEFYIPLSPLPIQQKIATIFSSLDHKIEAEENKKKALEALFKTLLSNLMTGKIRVNHLEMAV